MNRQFDTEEQARGIAFLHGSLCPYRAKFESGVIYLWVKTESKSNDGTFKEIARFPEDTPHEVLTEATLNMLRLGMDTGPSDTNQPEKPHAYISR